ncbi:MAG: hypothetical protein J0L53_18365 [Spirochaetes bacterium]|nr:hypothetical protein [Spirochaetota bacterium]
MEILLKSGAVFLIVSLALAWLLVAVKFLGLFTQIFTNQKYLLSAHIDYILMAILNWLVYQVVGNAQGSEIMAYLIVAGSALNPLLFLIMSVKPDIKKSPFSPFGMFSSFSFLLTTAGYGWAAWVMLV